MLAEESLSAYLRSDIEITLALADRIPIESFVEDNKGIRDPHAS